LSKTVCGVIACHGIKIRAREAEVRVIKEIEELSTELETGSFRDRSSLEDREIKVVDAGGPQ
jgi:hypothetical protein